MPIPVTGAVSITGDHKCHFICPSKSLRTVGVASYLRSQKKPVPECRCRCYFAITSGGVGLSIAESQNARYLYLSHYIG